MTTTAPELDIRVPLATLANFSADGQVYRAYAHAIAVAKSFVALVPIELIDGDLTVVIDRCPVPWQEALSLIEDGETGGRAFDERTWHIFGWLAQILAPANWDMDYVEVGAERRVRRFSHPSGIRIGIVL